MFWEYRQHLGGNITAIVTAYSPQGYGLNYTWTVSDSTWLIKNGGATPTVTITAPNTYGATGTATITVSDTNGGYAIGIVALSTEPLTPTTPSAPTNLTATAGNKQVSLNWVASTGATSYNVYTSTTSGGPFKKVGTATTTDYTVTGLTNGTPYYFPISYYFVVTAVNSAGESGYSNEANATPTTSTTKPDVAGVVDSYTFRRAGDIPHIIHLYDAARDRVYFN